MSIFRALALATCTLLAGAGASQAQTHDGTLGPNDPVRPGGAWYDEYAFEVDEDEIVTVRMQSTSFDTYLIVRSPSGVETVSDDFEGTMISQVEVVAPEQGRWVAWASSYSTGTEGDYTLSIRTRETDRTRVFEGRLDRQDEQALKGEYFDTHTFELGNDREVMIQLVSLGFDGYLVVTRPDGVVMRDGGSAAELMQVGPMPSMRGRWRVDVTSEAAGMVGAYDLRVVEFRQ